MSASHSAHPSQPRYLSLLFCGLLALTAIVRIPGVNRPLVGNFSTKSVVYAMIVRNWVAGRADLWHPTLDCLVGGRRSLHMAEFPVSPYLTGLGWRLFGGSLDVWGRATSVAFSVASVALLFAMVRRRHGPTAALGAGLVLALSPVGIIYGQTFMLDASLVCFALAAFDATDRWLDRGHGLWLLLAAASMALLLLSKLYLIVWFLPLAGMVYGARRLSFSTIPLAILAAVLAVAPAVAWYGYVYRAALPDSPLAAHMYTSLQRNAQGSPLFDRVLWTPDFSRQVLDDLVGVLLTPVGFALLLAGFLERKWRQYGLWFVALAILMAAIPVKFYKMNYYYVAVLPPLCILAGLGWQVVCERLRPGRLAIAALLLLWLAFAVRYAARPAFVTPPEDRAVVAAAQAVQTLTAVDEPIVTVHGDAIDLLYYGDRPGWAVSPDAPDLVSLLRDYLGQGARYLVVAGPATGTLGSQIRDVLATERPVARGEGFAVYRLGQARRP
jgi:4-amino-4-deoxy-L-arabinose transferase-like glycosyltransferase